MTTLLLATANPHKVAEIRAILGAGFRCLALNDFAAAPTIMEDADSFAGNATKKAVALAEWLAVKPRNSNCAPPPPNFVLADDSGLEVDALNGAPGIHSARFAAMDTGQAGNSIAADNNAKLLRLLAGVPLEKRTARFRCVIALASAGGAGGPASPRAESLAPPQLFEGVCEGRILFAPRGEGGFGYDPLFVPAGFEHTFAELGEAVKNRLSHRARALARLKEALTRLAT